MRIAIVVSFLAASLCAQSSSPQPLQPGKVIDKVVCENNPSFSYALYLPSSYDPAKKWPILYCFDPRKFAKIPLNLFRNAAEKYGYIVASSNDSMSDDPTAPNLQAMMAMWEDTHRRFTLDEKRAYASGMSGGARLACDMGYRYPDEIAGVIGCGAGFPPDRLPSDDTPFPYFGTIGIRDFNFYEMRVMESKLKTAGLTHRIRAFDGGHEWAPEAVCTEALEWMELLAMKKGTKPRDEAFIQSRLDHAIQKAKAHEDAGRFFDAAEGLAEVVSDFDGLADVAPIQEKLQSIQGSSAYQVMKETWARRDQEAAEFGMKLTSVIKSLRTGSRIPELATIKAYLKIDELKKERADTSDPEESLHAERLLSTAAVQSSFYLPRMFQERGDFPRAVLVLSLAVDINPDSYWAWYNLACSYALADDREKALDALRKAVDSGFYDIGTMESDFDLRILRDEKEYKKLEDAVRKNAQKKKADSES